MPPSPPSSPMPSSSLPAARAHTHLRNGKPPRIRGWAAVRVRGHMRTQNRYARLVTHTLTLHAEATEESPPVLTLSLSGADVSSTQRRGEITIAAASGERLTVVVRKPAQFAKWSAAFDCAARSVDGYYRVRRDVVLGRGSFSRVFLGFDRTRADNVAVKVMKKTTCSRQELEYAANEARVLSFLVHPSVIRCHDIFDGDAELVVVMRQMAGGTLEDSLPRIRALPLADALRVCAVIMYNLLTALAYLHDNNVVHRDIKAENILLSDSSDTPMWAASACVSDFGFAHVLEPGVDLTQVVGTPHYLAPETLRRDASNAYLGYGPQVDVWAAGVVLHWMLTGGQLPYGNVKENGNVPPHSSTPADVEGTSPVASSDSADRSGDDTSPNAHLNKRSDSAHSGGAVGPDDDSDNDSTENVSRIDIDPTPVFRAIRSVPDVAPVFDGPAFDGVPESARNLLSSLLHPLPNRRLSAFGALAHPFLAGVPAFLPSRTEAYQPGDVAHGRISTDRDGDASVVGSADGSGTGSGDGDPTMSDVPDLDSMNGLPNDELAIAATSAVADMRISPSSRPPSYVPLSPTASAASRSTASLPSVHAASSSNRSSLDLPLPESSADAYHNAVGESLITEFGRHRSSNFNQGNRLRTHHALLRKRGSSFDARLKLRAVALSALAVHRLRELLRPQAGRRRVTFGLPLNMRADARKKPRPKPIEQPPVGVDGIRYNVGLLPSPRRQTTAATPVHASGSTRASSSSAGAGRSGSSTRSGVNGSRRGSARPPGSASNGGSSQKSGGTSSASRRRSAMPARKASSSGASAPSSFSSLRPRKASVVASVGPPDVRPKPRSSTFGPGQEQASVHERPVMSTPDKAVERQPSRMWGRRQTTKSRMVSSAQHPVNVGIVASEVSDGRLSEDRTYGWRGISSYHRFDAVPITSANAAQNPAASAPSLDLRP